MGEGLPALPHFVIVRIGYVRNSVRSSLSHYAFDSLNEGQLRRIPYKSDTISN